jgi:hypothetical protein
LKNYPDVLQKGITHNQREIAKYTEHESTTLAELEKLFAKAAELSEARQEQAQILVLVSATGYGKTRNRPSGRRGRRSRKDGGSGNRTELNPLLSPSFHPLPLFAPIRQRQIFNVYPYLRMSFHARYIPAVDLLLPNGFR